MILPEQYGTHLQFNERQMLINQAQ